jgi:MFS family permease
VGGAITTYLSWHWIFYLNLPIGVVGAALVLRFIPRLPPQPRRPFDTVGFLYTAAGVSALLYGLDGIANPGDFGWIFPTALVVFGAGLLWIAFNHARRTPHPLISLSALKIPTYTIASVGGGALVRIPVRAMPFILVLMLQVVHGMSAFHAGLLLLAVNAGDLVLKTVTTPVLRRYGFRNVLIVSGYVCVLPVIACALFVPGTPDWVIFTVLTISGMGRSFLFTGMSTLAFADVPQEETGGASVFWYLGQMATQAFGISLAAIFMNMAGWATGAPPGVPTMLVCQIALVVMGLIGIAAVSLFFRLERHAGAHVSGQKIQTG